eukprot:980119-Pyramimonas_sp.AAC.1
MEYVLQSHAAALARGQPATFDTFQHSVTERWPLHVYEAAVYALNAWKQHGVAPPEFDEERHPS